MTVIEFDITECEEYQKLQEELVLTRQEVSRLKKLSEESIGKCKTLQEKFDSVQHENSRCLERIKKAKSLLDLVRTLQADYTRDALILKTQIDEIMRKGDDSVSQ